MSILIYLFIFFLGLSAGSFLNCIVYRLEKKESFLQGRSFCPHCRHILSWQDLVPVLGFLIVKGRCRYCQKPISWQYPLVEIATATLFVLVVHHIFPGLPVATYQLLVTGYWLLITFFLIIIFVYDLRHYIIPDKIVFPAIAIALIFNFQFLIFNEFPIFIFSILNALGAAAFFLTIVLISQGKWMGVGDIKLAFLMGLVLGWPNILVALFSAFLIGAIIGIGLMILGKKGLKSEVPFGPFLVTGTFLALFWGREIVNFYVQKLYLGAF